MGHVTPFLAPATYLRNNGHRVGFIDYGVPVDLERHGFLRFRIPDWVPDWDEAAGQVAALAQDPARVRHYKESSYITFEDAAIDAARNVITAFDPDVVVTDGHTYPAILAAHIAKRPMVSYLVTRFALTPDLHQDRDLVNELHGRRMERFVKHGASFDFRVWECLSNQGNALIGHRAFIGEDTVVPERCRLVNPTLPPELSNEPGDPFPEDLVGSGKYVFLSFGSQVYWQPENAVRVARATAALGLRTVWSTREIVDPQVLRGTEDILICVRHLHRRDYYRALEGASAIVNHAGSGGLTEALYLGTPILALPCWTGQAIEARLLEQCGAGIMLGESERSEARLAAALEKLVMPNSTYRQAAGRVRDAFRASDGAKDFAELVLDVADGKTL